MFKITRDKTIHLTRGDTATLEIGVLNEDGTNYIFKENDVVRFKVSKNQACNEIVLEKDVTPIAGSENVLLNLTSEDTRIGEIISKVANYWYEIELNPNNNPQTIIGFDESGAKLLKLYPELGDKK